VTHIAYAAATAFVAWKARSPKFPVKTGSIVMGLVEVKRSTESRIRRELIGQMLD
jgi:hypothetical protein